MSVGLFDRDLLDVVQHGHLSTMGPKYNIQIMKLSSYYKQRRELVSLITNLSRAKYYTKVYYRHNDVNLKFPAEIYELPDVELGGYAINPKYQPLPIEIERCAPDVSIYAPFFRDKSQYTQLFWSGVKAQNRGCHIQFSLDGNSIWEESLTVFDPSRYRQLFIHDSDITAYETELAEYITSVNRQTKDTTRSISFQNPVTLASLDTLRKFMESRISFRSSSIICLDNCSLKEYQEIYSNPVMLRLFGIGTRLEFTLPTTKSIYSEMELFLLTYRKALAAISMGGYYLFNHQPFNEDMDSLFSVLLEWSSDPLYIKRKNKFPPFITLLRKRGSEWPAVVRACTTLRQYYPRVVELLLLDPQMVKKNGGIIPI